VDADGTETPLLIAGSVATLLSMLAFAANLLGVETRAPARGLAPAE